MKYLVAILFCLVNVCAFSNTNNSVKVLFLDSAQQVVSSELISIEELNNVSLLNEKPNPVFQIFRKKQKLNKKITSAVLAFPFPFGIVGLHRIYLGTKPHVPVVYIASLGGVFGVLPFIDFCAIIFDKDFDSYRDNGKVLMWVKD
jgi:TM2 domain-containing membrane protein YozV